MTLAAAGADVQILDTAPPASTLTDTGTLFVAGLADRGVASGQLSASDAIHSLGDFVAKHGALQSYNGNEYATVQAYFAEGGTRLYFSRQVGPAAVKASAAVPASSSKFTATAKGAGAYGNNLTVAVASSVITVKESGVVVEVSPTLADIAAAQTWATNTSKYIDITPLTTGALADSTAVALTAGADDRTNITDTERQAAIDRFGSGLGPGQVCMPGDTRSQAHQMLAQHALDKNRFALGDAPDSSSAATVASAGTTVRALGKDLARHIQILDPWLIAPGTTAGTTRTIPPCGVQAGLYARVDSAGNPNQAAAGPKFGASRFATAAKYARTLTDRGTLAAAGITPILNIGGVLQTYDDITPVDPDINPEWLGASGNRLVMRIVADSLEIARSHMFAQEDGNGLEISAFNGDLKGMLARWWSERALYGATAADAFRVETGASVNTPTTIANRQLKAALALKISPAARQVSVQITNTKLTEAL